MDSKPVAWTDEQELRDVGRGGCGYLFTVNPVTPHADERRIILLYRHAQQPLVPDELLKEHLRLVGCMLSDYRDSNYGDAQRWIRRIAEASDAFEEKHGLSPWEMARKNFRAAMLQAGNSPAQSYCSPAQNSVAPEQSPIDHGYRPDCECTGCKATARICAELAGWIPVSERMPEAGDDMIVFTDGIVMSGISYTKKKGFYIQALEYDDDEPVDSVTHWMPLPAAPQEVKSES
ncbi:TPA: DUF551 domain-containing protein [Klebsiella pneumoniae]